MNSSPWISPTLSLIPWAWVIVRPCEIIGAFNANGSPAHSLFSPGNRVLQSAKGPMSYCSARTNLRLWGKWQKPTALSPPLSPSLYVSFASLCPSGRGDSHHTENPRLYHSCAVVRRPVTGVLCGCRQNDRRSLGSLVSLQRLTTDSHDWWRKAFPRLTALLGLPCDLWGKQREECGRRRGRLSDLQITHGKKQIGLIWEHAHTCARGKANHELHCRRQSQ